MKRRALAIFMAFMMLMTSAPLFSTFAAAAECTITVGDGYAKAGSEVSVDITIQNNPGIIGMTLGLSYDEDKLTLTSVKSGEAFDALTFTTPKELKSGVNLPWDAEDVEDKDIKDGVIATLTFKISEEAQVNKATEIRVSYGNNAILDRNLESVTANTVAGEIMILDYWPGDVNDDNLVNTTDVVYLRRFIAGGYGVKIKEFAADVNDDDAINTTDVVFTRRYIAGGYGVTLKPHTVKCTHENIQKIDRVEPTAQKDGNKEYWYCAHCDKCFEDAEGLDEISRADTVLTYTAGTYNIVYHLWNNDSEYLQKCVLVNNNPTKYECGKDLKLRNIADDGLGFTFSGWFDLAINGEQVRTIAAGTVEEGDTIDLYAIWTKNVYRVKFDSPDLPVADVTYTVDEGVPLINPAKQFGYTFIGWSNDDGFLVNRIKPGTTGNITLHANWTSNRNKATSYAKYSEPWRIEDVKNGQIIHIYSIGKIDNVPLNKIKWKENEDENGQILNSDGIEIDEEFTVEKTISEETGREVAEMVSEATTKSSAWTLSSDWNQIYSTTDETEEIKGKTSVRTDSEGNVTGGNYFISNSEAGSTYISTSSGGTSSSSAKVTTDTSVGFNASYDEKAEKYCDAKLSASNTTEVSAGVSLPVDIVKVEAGVKNTTTVGAEVSSGRKDETSRHFDSSYSGHVGTYNENNESSYYDAVQSNESSWNTTSGFEQSYQTSKNTEISNAINEQILNKTSISASDAIGGSESNVVSDTNETTKGKEYVNTVVINEEQRESKTVKVKTSAKAMGYYRLVDAGTVHVFGVVGYDVATKSYYTYTYNVLDNERHTYLDFSLEDPSFKDCQNSVVNFEIPFEVNEYIMALTGKTEGLEIGLDGKVTAYKGEDETVVVPQYYSADNHDGTYSAVKVESFTTGTFKENTNISTIVLPAYITEIPDNAFAGCTNLKKVIAFGVTKIGNNAFKDCVNLEKFSIDNKVTSLGTNAFENVPEVMVNAANADVADNAINCGAKRITVNISNTKADFKDRTIVTGEDTEYFALYSDGTEVTNLSVDSSAEETVINNIIFNGNENTPVVTDSKKVTLNRVTVNNAPGFALVLKNDNTELNLYSKVTLNSVSENAVLSKNVTVKNINPSVSCSLNVSDVLLVCGSFTDASGYLSKGTVKPITQQEYDNYFRTVTVTFNPNGGEVSENSRPMYMGQAYGELPVPTRQYYTFDGWYTAAEGGEKVEAGTVFTAAKNTELFAHWTLNSFVVTFNANGGNVSTATLRGYCSIELGILPVPARDYYTFAGWYTEAEGGSEVTDATVYTEANDVTVYAHWTLNAKTDWVKAADAPADAMIEDGDTKWTYTLREYSQSGSSSISGWTKYDTKRTSWGGTQGPVYSNPDNGVRNVWSEQYDTGGRRYHYYYYANSAGQHSYMYLPGDCTDYHEIEVDHELTYGGQLNGNYKEYGWCWKCDPYVTVVYGTRWYYQDPVYTYYYYRDIKDKEIFTDPTGTKDVSDIVKWVRYIPRVAEAK